MKMNADWNSKTKIWEESLLERADGTEQKEKPTQDDAKVPKVNTHWRTGGSICSMDAYGGRACAKSPGDVQKGLLESG